MNRFRIPIIVLFLSVNLLAGCSGPLKQTNISAYEPYRSSNAEDLGDQPVGFLTTAVVRGSGLGEYSVAITDIVEKIFTEELPNIRIITSRDTLNRINSASLTKEYAHMLEYYDITGILTREVLIKIGDVLGVKYIARPRLSSYSERTSTRFSAFGLSIMSTRETSITISLQLWDTSTGNIVWEGSGQAVIAMEAFRSKPVSFGEVAEAASRSLMKKFPSRKNDMILQ